MERVMDLDKKRLVRTALLKAFDTPQMPPSDDLFRLIHRLDEVLRTVPPNPKA